MRSRSRQQEPTAGVGQGGNGHGPAVTAGPDNGAVRDRPGATAAGGPQRRRLLRTLRNWRVRSRLLLLITIPTVAALVLGGASIATSVRSALTYERVQQRAVLGASIALLAPRLEDERDQTAYYIALPTTGRSTAMGHGGSATDRANASQQLQVVINQQDAANQVVSQVRGLIAQVRPSYTPAARLEADTVLAELANLPSLRRAATTTKMPALVVVQKYTQVINDLLTLESDTAQGASDPTLSQAVRVLGLVSLMKEEASEQRAILAAALIQHSLPPSERIALANAQSLQQSNLEAFNLSATTAQRQLWNSSVSRSFVYLASSEEAQAVSLQEASPGNRQALSGDQTTPDDWYGAMKNEIDYQLGGVERNLAASVIARAGALRQAAATSAIATGAAVLLFLALALLFTALVARSMVRPLRRLRAGALEVAGVKLPETVRLMSQTDGTDGPPEIEPIDVDSLDEIGEVARAFDQVHQEAIRLASEEAALRGNVNAMFVNLSRRSQSLVERQIRLIDDLEQGEQDSERLSSMFQLDHLATRMRRNSENLLVLAGHEVSRRWTQAVPLVDVLRAAVSEIEQYERVTQNVQPGISVRGQAVNDVVHLVAELAENATSFSAAETPVNISGHLLTSGGVLLDITDQGVGMGPEEMAHANWRLDNPPVVDVAVSRRMGLFVVARLAARHGIRVRLRPAAMGGLTALVWLPDEVITHEGAAAPPGLRRFEVPGPADTGGMAGAFGGTGGGTARGAAWSGGAPADGMTAAERAVSAALTPRFTPLRADGADTASFPVPTLDGFRPGAGTGPGRVSPPQDAPAGPVTGPIPVYGAPVSASDLDSRPLAGAGPGYDSPGYDSPGYGGSDSQVQQGVVVPSPGAAGEENRLPIFESVESDWFRRGRKGADRPANVGTAAEVTPDWRSPADAGWQAAQAVAAPAAGGTTNAGLPKRVPRANLVPGTVSGDAPAPPAQVRPPAITRDRFASFQRGVREARAAMRDGSSGPGEDSRGI